MHKLLALLLSLITVPAQAAYLQQTAVVGAQDGKHCNAYLHALSDTTGAPIIMMLAGTGIYSTGNAVDGNGVLAALVNGKKAVVVTIDKPGIQYVPEAKDGYSIDDSIYNRHTQRDLIACAENAIRWASGTKFSKASSDVYFWGHSEGSQVAVRTYAKLWSSERDVAMRVKAIFLSGLVMEPWDRIINSQLDDAMRPVFWKAISDKDDNALRSMGGLAYAYWEDILKTPANKETLMALADANAEATFQVFHGMKDANTLPKPVEDFEELNAARKNSGKPSLKFYARYYDADHHLNMAAFNDMIFAFSAYLN